MACGLAGRGARARPLQPSAGRTGAMKTFDAIVVGAGPAGATTALALSRRGRRVALVEKVAFPRRKVCGEFLSRAGWTVLDRIGIAHTLRDRAGPPVRSLGIVCGSNALRAPSRGEVVGWAIERHHLDPALRDAAAAAGAQVYQPCSVQRAGRVDGTWHVDIEGDAPARLIAPVLIDAHGSWERGPVNPQDAKASTLLGFKARFRNAALPVGHMPLVLFPGGYGGLVHLGANEVGFSFCIRRSVLSEARATFPGLSAGEAAYLHALKNTPALAAMLDGATREGAWVGAGPLRPGFREPAAEGIFRVGNAAGEAHPLVAEGICMAVEGGALLADVLCDWNGEGVNLPSIERAYRMRWRRTVASRIVAASAFERV